MENSKIEKIEGVTQGDIFSVIRKWENPTEYKEWTEKNKEWKEENRNSKKYWLKVREKRYPSKSIFGLAYNEHYGENTESSDWSGGISKKDHAAIQLRNRLGFEIVSEDGSSVYELWEKKNENVLIRRDNKSFFNNNEFYISKDIEKFFNAENIKCGEKRDICFHYMEKEFLGEIVRSSLECCKVLWKTKLGFREDSNKCSIKKIEHIAIRFQRISQSEYGIELLDNQAIDDDRDEPYVTVISRKEGGKQEFYGTKHERNYANRKNAIKIHVKKHGSIKCMICGFDFEEIYGEAGRNFIEVHHIKPLSDMKEKTEVNPETDLVCICANCHRIIHRHRDKIYSMEEMKELIGNKMIGIKGYRDD